MTDYLIQVRYRGMGDQFLPLCEFALSATSKQVALEQAQKLEPVLMTRGWLRVEQVQFEVVDLAEWLAYHKSFYRTLKEALKDTETSRRCDS